MSDDLSLLVFQHFDPRIMQRGEDIFLSDRIGTISHKGNEVKAKVYGSAVYEVRLHLVENRLTVSCECHYYDRTNLCKHIFAVILKAESRGLLKPASHITEVDIFESNYEDFDEDVYGEDSGGTYKETESEQQQLSEPDLTWKDLLEPSILPRWKTTPDRFTYFYYLDSDESLSSRCAVVDIKTRMEDEQGNITDIDRFFYDEYESRIFKYQSDRAIFSILMKSENFRGHSLSGTQYIRGKDVEILIPLMAQTGRLYIRDSDYTTPEPVRYDSTLHKIEFGLEPDGNGDYELVSKVTKNGRDISSEESTCWYNANIVVTLDCIARIESDDRNIDLFARLRGNHAIPIPKRELSEFMSTYYRGRNVPAIALPPELQTEEIKITPVPCAVISEATRYATPTYFIELFFDYEEVRIREGFEGRAAYDAASKKAYVIDMPFHYKAASTLREAGAKWRNEYRQNEPRFTVTRKALLPLIDKLLKQGWIVEGKEGAFRNPGTFSFSVSSGIDWFDLEGDCCYGDQAVKLPELLAAAKKGDPFVKLNDGSLGMLPMEWIKKFSSLAGMGTPREKSMRFKHSQTLLIDMLLENHPEVSCDAVFNKLRNELKSFSGVEKEIPPPTFQGTLRPYQKEGMGWLRFLQKFGLGGCLADDMGLGKTVQVLALLEARKQENNLGTSLVVAPRSVVYNWIQETYRFAPSLSIFDYSDSEPSARKNADLASFDLVIITYGTLRRDISVLQNQEFDYVVLDEAQAIKNKATATAKATRLLKSNHRLALSGTPVENYLSDLWSIFEFLNPGMLGSSSAFKNVQSSMRSADDQTCSFLRKIMRPFILRRTKGQVASDLPERTEEVLMCDMEPLQRKKYDELRDYYRATLLAEVKVEGMGKSKFHVLEALLRLRQAACHPGLVKNQHINSASVKVETLLTQIDEICQEGHKCLVFSQFTSFLDIIRKKLQTKKIDFEYLDGSTRDRKKRVDRFQNDPECTAFLISLKAGGTGLNLTAADYVFVLDPWWNPAVEAQAIDRAHRIGQTRPVFAYKLICRDTVEEKVLELQSKKRKLAESIISEDESLLSSLTEEDLAMLLG
ncbi:MAG: SNF2-related protein [Chitinispirillaceae bacterium]